MSKRLIESSDEILDGYIQAALWSSMDDNGLPFDKNYNYSDIDSRSIQKSKKDIASFMKRASGILDKSDMKDSAIGHNFWLSRNGHGAGFFDVRELEQDEQKEVQKIASSFGECYISVGNDGKVSID